MDNLVKSKRKSHYLLKVSLRIFQLSLDPPPNQESYPFSTILSKIILTCFKHSQNSSNRNKI